MSLRPQRLPGELEALRIKLQAQGDLIASLERRLRACTHRRIELEREVEALRRQLLTLRGETRARSGSR